MYPQSKIAIYARLFLLFSFLNIICVSYSRRKLITGSLSRVLSCNHDDLVRPLANMGHPCPGPKFFSPRVYRRVSASDAALFKFSTEIEIRFGLVSPRKRVGIAFVWLCQPWFYRARSSSFSFLPNVITLKRLYKSRCKKRKKRRNSVIYDFIALDV